MADIGAHTGNVVHDPASYARSQVLEGLPFHAQSRYRAFSEQLLELEAQQRHLRERRDEKSQRVNLLVQNARAAKASGSGSAEHHEASARAGEHELEQLNHRFSKANAARINIERILNLLNEWLSSVAGGFYSGVPYGDAEPTPAKLRKNEDFTAAILRVRREWSDLQMQLAEVSAAPPPASEIRQIVRAELERRHAEAAVGYRWRKDALGVESFELHAPDIAPWGAEMHPMGMITGWLLRLHGVDAIAEKFCTGIDDNAPGIPRADKQRLIAELEAKIVEIELAECSLIEQAQQEGQDVQYRPNASPLALLRLQPVHPARPEVLEAAE